jgi:hypothetical protein
MCCLGKSDSHSNAVRLVLLGTRKQKRAHNRYAAESNTRKLERPAMSAP